MPANESMTAEEFRTEHTQGVDAPAVAVDPGTTTGVGIIFPKGHIRAKSWNFWRFMVEASNTKKWRSSVDEDVTFIVEAPYATQWGKAQDNSAMAYNSGAVAREAELLVEGLKRRGYEVVEHDPHSAGNSPWSSGKWDSETAQKIVGDWEGPDNEHTRDALKMLFIYNVI